MRPIILPAATALLITLSCAAALADEPMTAKAHYQKATAHFAIGEFDDAAKEYESAYKLHPDPALLFDAAQAHRLAGHHQKALLMYRNYLHLYPTGASVVAVRNQIVQLNSAIAADEKAKSAPPVDTQEPTQQMTDDKPPHEPAKVESAPPVVVAAAPPVRERTPLYKKWWLWTAVGGVVVVAAVVTIAVVETRGSSNSFSNVPDIGPGASRLVTLRFGAAR